ncbi:MAG: hypothetical protein KKF89_06115 [Nanoarchaeota archaeon]|nr:hypothetical protein [Nanoarchaeota archaeon]MBU1855274.1 hypothetical protein [Nanoarchaeota archaeon]
MELGKRAIMFTFMAILIAGLLSSVYSTHQITPLDYKVELEKMRINTLNRLVDNINSYAEISLRASGYRALEEMINYIDEEEKFYDYDELNTTFNESATTGKINNIKRLALENLTINELMFQIKNITNNEFNISMEYYVSDVWIDQKHPFSITAYMNISIEVRDKNVVWNITEIKETEISIEGLKDPLYFFMETTDYKVEYNSTFKKTPILARKFNLTTYEEFVNNSEYIVSSQKITIVDVGIFEPYSFFGRLTNDNQVKNNKTLTIISIVNPKMISSGIPPKNESYADFMIGTEFTKNACNSQLKIVDGPVNSPIMDTFNLILVFNITEPYKNVNC